MRGFVLIVLVALLHYFTEASSGCEDWTLCSRVLCAAPPAKCPTGEYLVWDDCGCCQSCSKYPKNGPCGKCDQDVVCWKKNPVCRENQISTIDHCGCCKVCKNVLDEGAKCSEKESTSAVCNYGLKCVGGICKRQ
ncbi:uncharacterized protein LOC143199635 [Rhynchophorus ferrugineus]|uniref:uncharacterized protein LOC143199635 n=1 Tax=Rhynchophorus ferrugineus TaxID=354439 RepID=UPI003FCC3AA4